MLSCFPVGNGHLRDSLKQKARQNQSVFQSWRPSGAAEADAIRLQKDIEDLVTELWRWGGGL